MRPPWILLFIAAPLLAQEPSIHLRPLELNFKDVQLPRRLPVSLFKTPAAPIQKLSIQELSRVCAIPLLEIRPKGNFPMPVMKPRESHAKMPVVTGPAPACDDVVSERP